MPKKPEESESATVLDDHLAHLTPKQAKAIPLLAMGTAASEVAKVTKVSPGQLSVWKKDRRFMSALADARRSTIREAEHELTALAREAVRTLRDLMLNSPSELIRFRATAIVLERLDTWAARDAEEPVGHGGFELREVLSVLAAGPGWKP